MEVAKFSASCCYQKYRSSSMLFTSWYLQWKVFQGRKEQPSPAFESHVSTIHKASNSVLLFVKVMLTRSSFEPKNPCLLHWLV